MNDESMKGTELLKNDSQQIINDSFVEENLFPEYNKEFKDACPNADINTMKNLLKDEYQLNVPVSNYEIQIINFLI